MKHETKRTRQQSNQKGFSLLELLMAIVLFFIVTGAIYGLLQVSRIDRDRSSNRSDMLKNARMAINLIGRDAVNAGLGYSTVGANVPDNFLSGLLNVAPDPDLRYDLLTSVVAANNVNSNNLLNDPNARTDAIAFVTIDNSFNNGNVKTVSSVVQNGTAARAFILNDTNTGSNQYDLYLLQFQNGSQVVAMATGVVASQNFIDFEPGDPIGINLPWLNVNNATSTMLQQCGTNGVTTNCSSGSATLKRIQLVTYKVKTDGTLVRITYGNNPGQPAAAQIQEMPLAYGVEDLHFTYMLENGTVTNDPSAGPDGVYGTGDDTPFNMNKVRQVTIKMTVRSVDLDKQTGQPLKITLSSTFSTRNLEYDVAG